MLHWPDYRSRRPGLTASSGDAALAMNSFYRGTFREGFDMQARSIATALPDLREAASQIPADVPVYAAAAAAPALLSDVR